MTFREELTTTLNQASVENESDTPDFILADYLTDCLTAFDKAVNRRRDVADLLLRDDVVGKALRTPVNGGRSGHRPMTDLTAADLDTLDEQATDFLFRAYLWDGDDATALGEADAERIAALTRAAPALIAQAREGLRLREGVEELLADLRELHHKHPTGGWCQHDGQQWPCSEGRLIQKHDGAA